MRWLLERMTDEWKQMEFDNKAMNDQIDRISQEDERCRRLRQIPGFGLIVSTATVAAIGNGSVRCLCARMRSLQVDAPAWLCPTTRKNGGSVGESNTPKIPQRYLPSVLKNTHEVLTGVENSLIYLIFLRLTRRASCRVLLRIDPF